MFEKEDFEKYMKDSEDYYDNREPITERKLYQLWKDGADFGYSKAKEEDKWHYVKDGDLPPLDTNILVIHRWARTPEVGKRIKVFINSSVWVWAMCSDRFRYTSDDENVIAWKEIVLPKE